MSKDRSTDFSTELVIRVAGLASAVVALLLVYLLGKADINAMGFYVNYIIPAGAILVGLVAGCGYGIAARVKQYKVTRNFLISIFLLQVGVYFAAQYITYRQLVGDDPAAPSFVEYYQWSVESTGWAPDKPGQEVKSFGKWGWGIELLAILGFAGGSLIVLAVMGGLPYCGACGRYMSGKKTVQMPAAAPQRKVKKADIEGQKAYEAEKEQATALANGVLDEIRGFASQGDRDAVRAKVEQVAAGPQKVPKVKAYLQLQYHECATCDNFAVSSSVVVDGKVTQTLLKHQKQP